jgi:hypothetical protein
MAQESRVHTFHLRIFLQSRNIFRLPSDKHVIPDICGGTHYDKLGIPQPPRHPVLLVGQYRSGGLVQEDAAIG